MNIRPPPLIIVLAAPLHRIRQQRDTELPNGVPNHIYAFPEECGFADCGKFTKIDIALNRYNVCQNNLSNSLIMVLRLGCFRGGTLKSSRLFWGFETWRGLPGKTSQGGM